MRVIFELPHLYHRGSNPDENAIVLRALLECLVGVNLAFLKYHSAPALYQSGVVYQRTHEWDSIPALYSRGFGDCKSLSAALIAEYRKAGKTAVPVFRWVTNEYGDRDFHILVQTLKGYEDPSRKLGMNQYNARML